MSHYSKIETEIVEREFLLKTLYDMGYASIEVHEVGSTSMVTKVMYDQNTEGTLS